MADRRRLAVFWAPIYVILVTGFASGAERLGSKRNSFNSVQNLNVDPNEFEASCYGKPCEPVVIPEDPRSQRVLVLLERLVVQLLPKSARHMHGGARHTAFCFRVFARRNCDGQRRRLLFHISDLLVWPRY